MKWGLIPWFATEPKLTYPTNNARSEALAEKASYKDPWKRGQRCIIPAVSFDEPYWGPYELPFSTCEWLRFRRADGQPWGLAGLWSVWTDKATGEAHEGYTMLTINADAHPLMGRMHKPDPKLGPDQQDRRSVIPIEAGTPPVKFLTASPSPCGGGPTFRSPGGCVTLHMVSH